MGLGVTVVVTVLAVWVSWGAFWGALSANVGMSRGARPGLGARWGFLLGPIGLGVVLARTRGGGRGIDERLTAGKQLADRYRTKAGRSVQAWREADTSGRSRAPGSAPGPSPGPAPAWGSPAADAAAPAWSPAPAPPVAPVWGPPPADPVPPAWGPPASPAPGPAPGPAPASPPATGAPPPQPF